MKEDAGHIRDEAAGERRAGGSARPYHPREAVPGIRQSIRQEVEDMLWETRARAKDHDSRQELEKEQRGLQILSGHPTAKHFTFPKCAHFEAVAPACGFPHGQCCYSGK